MKIKKCKKCNNPRWSKGMCKWHYLQEFPPKDLKKITEKQIEKNKIKAEETKKLHQFMYNWWSKQSPKVCWACGIKLGNEFHTYMVDHLIEKSKRPDLTFEEDNLYLICLDDHACKTNGFPKEHHKKAIEKAKQIFGIL